MKTQGLILILGLLVPIAGDSQNAPANLVRLSDETPHQNLSPHALYFEDPSAELSFEEIIASKEAVFAPTHKDTPNFGLSNSAFWFLIELENDSSFQDWIIDLRYPVLDFIDLYISTDGSPFVHHEGGENRPFNVRYKDHPNINFGAHLPPKSKTTLYFRLQSAGSIQLPLHIQTEAEFADQTIAQVTIYGLYYGVILVMILYNLLLFVSLRDPNYLRFVGFLTFFCLLQMTLNGIANQLIWPNSPEWSNTNQVICIFLVLCLGMAFARNFLHTQEYIPGMDKIVVWIPRLTGVFAVLALWTPYRIMLVLALTSALVTIALAIAIAVTAYARGYRAARFFLLAFGFFLGGCVAYVLKVLGVFPNNFLTNSSMQIGSALLVTLLSLALADRFAILKKENADAQQEALDHEKRAGRIQAEALDHEKKSAAILAQEVEQRKATQAQLEIALDRAQEAARLKGEFLSNVSHELRTPLNAVINVPEIILSDYNGQLLWHCQPCEADFVDESYTLGGPLEDLKPESCPDCDKEMVSRTKIDNQGDLEDHSRLLHRMYKSGKYLLRVVNDILDASKLDAGQMTLEMSQNDLSEILEEVSETIISLAHSKSIELKTETPPDLPPILGDGLRLSQILINLIGNAIKFTDEEGTVSVSAAARVDSEIDVIQIDVSDTGCGIPQEAVGTIFDSFRQADGSHTRRHGGTGLGLAIVRDLVELHGGRIWVETEEGVGSTFSFTIPRSQTTKPQVDFSEELREN